MFVPDIIQIYIEVSNFSPIFPICNYRFIHVCVVAETTEFLFLVTVTVTLIKDTWIAIPRCVLM